MRRMLAALTVLAVGLSLLTAQPASAASPAYIAAARATTTSLVLNGDAGCGNRVKLVVNVYDPLAEITSTDLDATVYDGANSTAAWTSFSLDRRVGSYSAYSGWVYLCAALETPGRYRAAVLLEWLDGLNWRRAERNIYFFVRRPTSLTYNAAPEPVRRGQYLSHYGRVMFDRYQWGPMYGADGVAVRFYLRRADTATYVYMGHTTTRQGGYYLARQRARESGVWRAVLDGGAARQSQIVGDAIVVAR